MAEYGSFRTTVLKLDIGPEHSSLGPGLAYLYGTFGYTVGKLVGQYSDSDRVSQLRQSLPKGARGFGVPQVQRGEREGRVTHKQARRGDWLSAWESLWGDYRLSS